jgi:glutathione S-transferase
MRILYGLRQSPWTERARWALDHHRVSYRYREHVPMLGELVLRRRAGTKRASVPLLVDGPDVFRSSLEIARHADQVGGSAPLVIDGEVERWDAIAERVTQTGRTRTLANLRRSRRAQAEALPAFIPAILRPAMAPAAALAARFVASKYAATAPSETIEDAMRPDLDELRTAIRRGAYLTGSFSWADIAVATSLQALRPHVSAPLGPATREGWTSARLAADYEDLLAWRDSIYEKHRG